MAIDLAPLYTAHVQLRPPITVADGPAGTRMIFEVASVELAGQGFQGRMLGQAAADWLVVGPDGTATLDIRATVQLHDGAIIFVQAPGKADFRDPEAWPKDLVLAPRYETSDPRYAFLNRVQAIAKGSVDASLKVTYEAFLVQ